MRDITQRKQNNQALMNSEERLKALIEALPDSTFIIDTAGHILTVLKSQYDSTDLPENIAPLKAGQTIHNVYPDDHARFCLEKIQLAIESNSSQLIEYPCPFRGEPYRYETRVIPFYDTHSDKILVFWVTRDITDRILSEQNRLELVLEKEKLNILRDFINGMVHDLKTPLAVIKTSVDLLRLYNDPEKSKGKIQVMDRQIDYLTQMLDDMLAVVHLDAIQQQQFEELDVRMMMQEIIDDLHFKAEAKNIQLGFESSDFPAQIHGSRNQLRRALSNLVDNAIKYTLHDGTVDVTMSIDEQYLRLDIEDSGIGIEQEELPDIFERFVRGTNAHSVAAGTGLGLAITKQIIDIHEGTLTVESWVNKGSTFQVQLPQKIEQRATQREL